MLGRCLDLGIGLDLGLCLGLVLGMDLGPYQGPSISRPHPPPSFSMVLWLQWGAFFGSENVAAA